MFVLYGSQSVFGCDPDAKLSLHWAKLLKHWFIHQHDGFEWSIIQRFIFAYNMLFSPLLKNIKTSIIILCQNNNRVYSKIKSMSGINNAEIITPKNKMCFIKETFSQNF